MKKLMMLLTIFMLTPFILEAGVLTNSLKLKSLRTKRQITKGTVQDKRKVTCSNFKGTYEGSKLVLTASATGGKGIITHTLVYMLGDGFETEDLSVEKFSKRKTGREVTFRVKLPVLKNNVPYVNQALTLITKDSNGMSAINTLNFFVSKTSILSPSTGKTAHDLSCYQRYEATEAVTGVLSNGSTTLSTLDIKHGIQRLHEVKTGHKSGMFITPQLNFGIFSLSLTANQEYFREVTKQQAETIEVVSAYSLNPGDFIQLFAQSTRYIKPYDVTMVTPCGDTTKYEAAYMFQWWGHAYHVVPVDPYDDSDVNDFESVGAIPMNTCPEKWSEDNLSGSFVGFGYY